MRAEPARRWWPLAALVLAAAAASEGVFLGEGLGTATASATQLTAATIELELEVSGATDASMVAYLLEPGGPQQTVPLASRGEGRFGIVTEVRRVDFVVVFEALGATPRQSEPFLLTELGVDPAVLGVLPSTPTTSGDLTAATRGWGWAGLALACVALALLAVWALPDRAARASPPEPTPSGEDLPTEP